MAGLGRGNLLHTDTHAKSKHCKFIRKTRVRVARRPRKTGENGSGSSLLSANGAALHLLIGALQFTGRSDSGAGLWDDDSNGELGFIDISPPRKLDLTSPVARCYRVVAGWRPPQDKVQLSRWMSHVNRRAVEVEVRGIGKVQMSQRGG